ncbi:MAG: hypothetical protein DCC75_08255 [Proteobacteria bacterium]|nr:MAG: hypothetical protein DCC75_08255 [Pseudomonadota bacterium]
MSNKKLKVSDRVKRLNSNRCYGTVKELRTEVTATNQEDKDKSLMVGVLWDNGTHSFVGPDAVELIKG